MNKGLTTWVTLVPLVNEVQWMNIRARTSGGIRFRKLVNHVMENHSPDEMMSKPRCWQQQKPLLSPDHRKQEEGVSQSKEAGSSEAICRPKSCFSGDRVTEETKSLSEGPA